MIVRSLLLSMALGALLGVGPAEAEPLQMRIGWAQTPGHLAPLIQELQHRHPEVFRHLGTSYTYEPVRFQGSTPQIVALAAGELQIAAFGSSSLALAITNAQLEVRVVADVIQDGTDGHFSQPYVVAKDGPIQKIADIKGKRIATNAIGSASDASMRIILHRAGIQDSDFTSIEANFANMPAMIEAGKVDLIPLLPQFAPEIEASGKFRSVFRISDAFGNTQTVHWAMRADFIAAHRDQLVDFFEDHIRAIRWFLDPAHHAEAIQIAADVTKLPPAGLEYNFTKKDWYRSPDARPVVAAIQTEIDESVKLGILPKPVQIAPHYVDLSLVEDAKRRIDK
jgi:sulfonate transport system substrate-binding protein